MHLSSKISLLVISSFMLNACVHSGTGQPRTSEQTTAQEQAALPSPLEELKVPYISIVRKEYGNAYNKAKALEDSVSRFLANPTEAGLEKARNAWREANKAYGRTQAFRFYGGPADFVDLNFGLEGPHNKIASWPVNPGYIESIINSPGIQINKSVLVDKNSGGVATGLHAIEYLLWGDENAQAAGYGTQDFFPSEQAQIRRRQYLKSAAQLLVEDVEYLVDEWGTPQRRENYAYGFSRMQADEAFGNMLKGAIGIISETSRNMADLLDMRSYDYQQSRFSNTTQSDYLARFESARNVYYGNGRAGIHSVLSQKDEALASQIDRLFSHTREEMSELHDIRQIITSGRDSDVNIRMERIIYNLQEIKEKLKSAYTHLSFSAI